MDGLDGHAARPPLGGDDTRDRIADEFARIMGHATQAIRPAPRERGTDVDVATYLLNPPASPESVELRARRQRTVGIVSIIACVLLALVLVVPLPHRSGGPAEPDVAPPSSGSDSAHQPATGKSPAANALPRRVDVPGERVPARRLDTPRRASRVQHARALTVAHGVAPVPVPSRVPQPRPQPTRPAAQPTRPAPRPPASTAAPAMLVPLS